MAIGLGNNGSLPTAGQGSVAVAYGDDAAADDLLVALLGTASDDDATPTVGAWGSLADTVTGGSGAHGAGTGPRTATVYTRVADASEDTGGTFTVTNPGTGGTGRNTWGHVVRLTKALAQWDVVATGGVDNSSGTAYSATGAATLDITAGDVVLAVTSWPVGAAAPDTPTGAGLTIPGCTLAGLPNDAGLRNSSSLVGDDQRLITVAATVTAGSASGPPTYARTASASIGGGGTLFVRVREQAAGTDHTVGQTDSVGATDTTSADVGKVHIDNAGPTDLLVKDSGKTVTDSAGRTDAATREMGRPLQDDTGLTDELLIVKARDLAVTDPTGLTDEGAKEVGKVATDLGAQTDSATYDVGKVATDTTSLSDTIAKDFGRSATDIAGLTDSVIWDRPLSLQDGTGLTDSFTLQILSAGAIDHTDESGLSDELILFLERINTDPLGLSDVLGREVGPSDTDPLGLSDAAVWDRSSGVTDGVGLTDQAFIEVVRELVFTDDTGLSDEAASALFAVQVSYWDGTVEIAGTMTVWDGTAEVPVSGVEVAP